MYGALIVALNWIRITQDSYFKVHLSMVELIVKVLNEIILLQ